jgi:hypothetical protein
VNDVEGFDMEFNPLIPKTEDCASILHRITELASGPGERREDEAVPDLQQRWEQITALTDKEKADRDKILSQIIEALGIGGLLDQLKELESGYRDRIAGQLSAVNSSEVGSS